MSGSARITSRRLDAIAIGFAVLLAVWIGVFAGGGAGRSEPALFLLAGVIVATTVGRVLAARPGLTFRMLAVGIAGSMLLTWPGVLRAGGAPLGYANANATLASLGVIAAIGAAQAERDPPARRGWLGLAGLLAALTVATGSVAGVVALAVAVGLLGLSASTRWPGFAVVGGLIAVSLAVGVTTALALGSDIGGIADRAETRAELWAAAADFARQESLHGIGPGQFAEQNLLSSDDDLRWAHHGYLQVAAELGGVGLILVLGLIGSVWAHLWSVVGREPWPGSTAGVLTIVGLHGAVDYVWHFPAVLLVAGLLIGAGTSPRRARRQADVTPALARIR